MKKKKKIIINKVRVNNCWSTNYIEYKFNGKKNEKLSVEEYLDKFRPYLKDIINDLKKSGTQKIQLTKIINFISSKDDNDEQRVIQIYRYLQENY